MPFLAGSCVADRQRVTVFRILVRFSKGNCYGTLVSKGCKERGPPVGGKTIEALIKILRHGKYDFAYAEG